MHPHTVEEGMYRGARSTLSGKVSCEVSDDFWLLFSASAEEEETNEHWSNGGWIS